MMKKYFPIADWLPSYQRDHLSGDLYAGLTVGVMLIPQGMAYALIAGLPPVYGLYAALVPQVIYALLGTSRQLAVGAVAMDSLLVAAGISVMAEEGTSEYLAYAILLAFLVGAFQLLLGIFRLGFVTNLLSKPVISGFTSAAAIIIALNQLKHVLGYHVPKGTNAFQLLKEAILGISGLHFSTFIMSVGGLALIFYFRKYYPRLPGALAAVMLGTLLVIVFRLDMTGLKIVGAIPEGLPDFRMPVLQWTTILQLIPLSITIAVVAFMEAFSVAKAIEAKKRDHKVQPNQELIALGAANLLGSFFQSFPVSGGFSRSAVNYQMNANTQLTSFISASVIALTLLFLTPLFYYLPNAILASVILSAVIGLIDLSYATHLWQKNKVEFFLLTLTFFVTLYFSMIPGIVTGISCSILLLLYRLGYPHIARLGRVPGHTEFRNVRRFKDLEKWDGLILIRLDGPLSFVNIQFFKDYVEQALIESENTIEAVLVDAGPISHVDATAVMGMQELILSLRERNVRFYFADAIGPVRDQLHRSGLLEQIGRENMFMDLNDAIDFHQNKKENTFGERALQTDLSKDEM